jgi:biopolymer transport protein ExbD
MKPLLTALSPTLAALVLMLAVVAALPTVLIAREPIPLPPRAPAPGALPVVLVLTASGDWYADGVPVDAQTLEQRLAARGASLVVRFLPSAQLSTADVTASLGWLRRRTAGPVELELVGS